LIERNIAKEIEIQERIEIYKTLIDALEKQIPFKPHRFLYYDGQCKCGAVFLDRNTQYCGNCGQRLLWE